MATVVGTGTSVSPNSSTLSTLARQVIDYIQGDTTDDDLKDLAAREINTAIDEINSRTWKKHASTQTITTVTDDDEYELASTFKDPIVAHLVTSGNRKIRLSALDYKTFVARFEDRAGTTSPYFYTIDYGRRLLILEGKPDATFVSTYDAISLIHYSRLAYLTDSGSVHGGPPEFNAYLVWQGRASVAAIRGERSLVSYAEGKARTVMSELRISDGNTQTDWE